MVIEKLRNTLLQVRRMAGDDFSGIGIIVHDLGTKLPIFPLSLDTPLPNNEGIDTFLAQISSIKSRHHDGFHLISTEWKITHVAQYFSPPIVENADINRARYFGGRYLAAQFGSCLPGVALCGVASLGFGLAIFESGHEIHFEKI